ncbi:MAG: molecular chaperone TorD family protein [Candidatus Rokubacteria bacterium]|nr:molecular chaperone TorD family protein [Candidatus Rokubacteria bacterium]
MTAPPGLWRAFACLLEYPRRSPAAAARECAGLLAPLCAEAAAAVAAFAAFAERAPGGAVEEAYTRVFDLDATHCPYVGFHLFGESYKRSVFLVRMKTQARALGLALGSELPDHVGVLLRFLDAGADAEFEAELIGEALLPALHRMTATTAGDDESPAPSEGSAAYHGVLTALRAALEACHAPGVGEAAAAAEAPPPGPR